MDLVLGVSLSSRAARWVFVDGATGEGATVDRGSFDLGPDAGGDGLLDVVLADRSDDLLHAIGVTWTDETQTSSVLDALSVRGYGNVIAVSELEAGDVLAAGIADITEYEDVGVCIVEPDAVVVALVTPAGVTVDRIARPADGADAVELPSSVIAMMELDDWRPEAVFVVGSADDLDVIQTTLEAVTDAPVFSAADADLALARGAALASARGLDDLAPAPQQLSRVGALTSVVAAAAVTLVVSLSVAIGLAVTSEPADSDAPSVTAADESVARAAPAPAVPKVTPAEALKFVAQTMVVAVPQYVAPEPAYIPPVSAPAAPAPVFVPPAPPPAYTPPVPPKPRLRDRIIERIPILNRFHEPQYEYGP